uniref:Partial AB-hydrolase lipase domain-containing protein n=1 Tax=Strigamia maritima TaxID=126957 RepID=T1JHI9_STRMM
TTGFCAILYTNTSSTKKTVSCCNQLKFVVSFSFQNQCKKNAATNCMKLKVYKQIMTKTVTQIKSFGYNAESHNVHISDGYIITMQRIVPTAQNRVPVLLLPGGSCTPMTYLEHRNA